MTEWAAKATGGAPTADEWRGILEAHARWLRGEGGTRANLSNSNLSNSNLSNSNLSCSDLRGSNLSNSNLRNSNLSCSNLRSSDLSNSDLSNSNLSEAKEAELVIARTRILPEGSLIGWKKCRDGAIVCLIIPADAKRSHAFGRKCRAEFADVSGIVDAKGEPIEVAYSMHMDSFEYRKGERVKPDHWDEDWQEECAGGLHFYITRAEAEAHQ